MDIKNTDLFGRKPIKYFNAETEGLQIVCETGKPEDTKVYTAGGEFIPGIQDLQISVNADDGYTTAHFTVVGVRMGYHSKQSIESYWKAHALQLEKDNNDLRNQLANLRQSHCEIADKAMKLGSKICLADLKDPEPMPSIYEGLAQVEDDGVPYDEPTTTTTSNTGGTEIQYFVGCPEPNCCHSSPCTKAKLTSQVLEKLRDKVKEAVKGYVFEYNPEAIAEIEREAQKYLQDYLDSGGQIVEN